VSRTGASGGKACNPRNATAGSLRPGTRPSRLLVTAGVALLIFGVLPAYAASATNLAGASETVDVGSLDEIDCEPSPAELEDIAFIADQDGIPLDEAIARFGWQGCFGEVTGYLREVYSDQYAGAAIGEDGRRAWIAFKSDVPEDVADLVEAIPVAVQLIGGRGFSEAELNETLQSIYPDISNREDVVAASGGYDIETGVITIHAQLLETLTDPDQRERLRETLQPNQPVNTAITIEVIVVDELGGGDESSGPTHGLSPAVYASVLAAGVLVLLAGRLIRDRRRV
jgi:hypothetical protein